LRILFDQGTPVPLRQYLPGHTVATAFEMGWAEFANGDLLLEAEKQFEALVTTDQNLRYQQNLANRRLAILILPFASWPKLEGHKSKIVAAIEALQPGDYICAFRAQRLRRPLLPPRANDQIMRAQSEHIRGCPSPRA
jgi:hypothetical protein